MSVRSTAAVFAGALALVLPAAGPSLAYDHDGRGLGELQYRLADGRIAPVVDAVFPIDRAADAYELVKSDTTFGKVILDCT